MNNLKYILALLAITLCTGGFAGIVVDTPVVTDNYIKFVGTNADGNYKYILDTYEWTDRGPQFQLTLEALDAGKPAGIIMADLADENYWEPMFRFYTKQLAGEEMEAGSCVKRLYVKNVALLANQFQDYEELHVIGIEANGDYAIPDGCFQNSAKLDNLDSNIKGTLTLGLNIVNAGIEFVVNCSSAAEAQVWSQYKEKNSCHYTVVGGGGGIVEEEPVISDSYMRFSGVNAANNYRYILDTYEWADRGPQFQLTIEPLNSSKPAAFTTADLADENYWEPLFRKYTRQMAGEEMEARDNIKELYVKGVSLLPNQFANYEFLHTIGIEAGGDYNVPNGVFSGVSHLETFDCSVVGNLTLGDNFVNPNLAFTVACSSDAVKAVWQQYKDKNGCNYIIGGDNGDAPSISNVQISLTINGFSLNLPLKDSGGSLSKIPDITDAYLNRFTATVSGNVSELILDYCICPNGVAPSTDKWKTISASPNGDTQWMADNISLDLTDGLSSNSNYQLYFSFRTNDGENGRATYPSDGSQFRLDFSTGEITAVSSVVNAQSSKPNSWYTLDGRRLNDQPSTKGIYIHNGKKIAVK